MESNQVVISGVVIEVEPQRLSPAGVSHQRFLLQHRSRQEQVGHPREVFCRVWVEMRGVIAANAASLAVNDRIEVCAFLDRVNYKDDAGVKLILHAKSIQKI